MRYSVRLYRTFAYPWSQAPYALRGARFGTRFGVDLKLEDTLWAGLTDLHIKLPMGITAENLAEKYGLTMEECNAHAIQTQQRWAQAQAAGHFDAEITPVEIKHKRKLVEFTVDEHPKVMVKNTFLFNECHFYRGCL